MKHVVNMTSAASVGLMTLFVVDLVDMYFLSLLGEIELASAIGYAGTILFFTTSICIGMAIAAGALVSQAIGREDEDGARRFAVNVLAFGVIVAAVVSSGVWLSVPTLLSALGADGRSLELSTQYLRIIIPSMVVLVLGMAGSGLLRATGDARRAMMATVYGGLVNAVLDPILIFGLDMGIRGAAWASVAARMVVMLYALGAARRVHDLLGGFSVAGFVQDLPAICRIALPAMLTNIATPIGNAYVIAAMAKFGDSAVAGMSIIGRVIPVAFGIIFALSGAVGPIVGQNFGARQMDRVRKTVVDATRFCVLVVAAVSLVLFLVQDQVVSLFGVSGDAAELVKLFFTWIAFTFVFQGTLFVSNAAFNNLGYPHYSTLFNFAKATLGTIPFVYIGAMWYGAGGVLIGQALGTSLVGLAGIFWCFRMINRCGDRPRPGPRKKPFNPRIHLWPQSDTRG